MEISPRATTTDGFAVYCAHDALVLAETLEPNPRNPNTHPPHQIKLLAKIIAAQGWRAPITVSHRSGQIVRGHARLLAAIEAGCESVPVDFQHYENDEAELADLMADNRIAELAELDKAAIADLFALLSNEYADLSGFSESDIEEMLRDADMLAEHMLDIDDGGVGEKGSGFRYLVVDGKKVIMTDEEADAITLLLDGYAETHGSFYGFARWLIDGKENQDF